MTYIFVFITRKQLGNNFVLIFISSKVNGYIQGVMAIIVLLIFNN